MFGQGSELKSEIKEVKELIKDCEANNDLAQAKRLRDRLNILHADYQLILSTAGAPRGH